MNARYIASVCAPLPYGTMVQIQDFTAYIVPPDEFNPISKVAEALAGKMIEIRDGKMTKCVFVDTNKDVYEVEYDQTLEAGICIPAGVFELVIYRTADKILYNIRP